MNTKYHDVNYYLGSWGPQPVDDRDRAPFAPARRVLSKDDWRELAVRFAGYALEAIRDGRDDDAAGYAAGAVRFAREFQLAGGEPWE